MDIFLVILSGFFLLFCSAFLVYLFIQITKCGREIKRNHKVFDFRIKILNNNLKEYRCLPSYEEMLDNTHIKVEDFAKKERMLARLDDE